MKGGDLTVEIEVNFIAIILAGVISMVAGFLWYSPLLLGKPWMKEKGFTAEKLKQAQKQMGPLYGVSFVLSFVMAFVLSHVMTMAQSFFGYSLLSTGLTSAFWMWLGFIMPVQLTSQIFGEKNWKLFGIDTGYQLVSMIAMGVVIALV